MLQLSGKLTAVSARQQQMTEQLEEFEASKRGGEDDGRSKPLAQDVAVLQVGQMPIEFSILQVPVLGSILHTRSQHHA